MSKKNRRIDIRVDDETLDMVRRQATHYGLSVSELISKMIKAENRKIIQDKFSKNGNSFEFAKNEAKYY